jgi:hypothetical protein
MGVPFSIVMKVFFLIFLVPFIVAPSMAADFTYKEYSRAPELWKRGVVFGIARYVSAVAQPDEEAPYPVRSAFQRCLAGSEDGLLVRQVDVYVTKNPTSSNEAMVTIVMRALFDLCRLEIEKVKLPSRR